MFKGSLSVAATLYITVTCPFPKRRRFLLQRFDCNYYFYPAIEVIGSFEREPFITFFFHRLMLLAALFTLFSKTHLIYKSIFKFS